MSKTYKLRIDKGLCRDCGSDKIAKTSKSRCELCLKKNRIAQRATTQKYKAAKTCTKCGKNSKTESSLLCVKCSGRISKDSRNRTKQRKALGLCTRCGINKATGETTKCPGCLKRCRILETNNRIKKKQLSTTIMGINALVALKRN